MSEELENVLAAQHEAAKSSCAWWATVTWIGSRIYLFFHNPRGLPILGWLAFVLLGAFAASLIIGGGIYLIDRVALGISLIGEGLPGPLGRFVLNGYGWLSFVGEIMVTFVAARLIFERMAR